MEIQETDAVIAGHPEGQNIDAMVPWRLQYYIEIHGYQYNCKHSI